MNQPRRQSLDQCHELHKEKAKVKAQVVTFSHYCPRFEGVGGCLGRRERSAFEVARQRQTVAKPFSGECIPRLLLFSLSSHYTNLSSPSFSFCAYKRVMCRRRCSSKPRGAEGEPAGSLLPSRRRCCFHVSDANAEL